MSNLCVYLIPPTTVDLAELDLESEDYGHSTSSSTIPSLHISKKKQSYFMVHRVWKIKL